MIETCKVTKRSQTQVLREKFKQVIPCQHQSFNGHQVWDKEIIAIMCVSVLLIKHLGNIENVAFLTYSTKPLEVSLIHMKIVASFFQS